MAITDRYFAVPPARVFEVLSDPDAYADWVVGSHSIRGADEHWPQVGARFHHRVGTGPLKVADHTEVLEADGPHLLVLRARARPLGTAIVKLEITAEGEGSRVKMTEVAGDPLTKLVLNPLTDWLIKPRNERSLERLQRIAETGITLT